MGNSPPDIRDIKGLIDIYSWTGIWIVLLIGLAAVAAYLIFRRKNPKPVPVVVTPIRPPHEVAVEAIRNLRGWALTAENVKRFHFALSDIIRTYLESRFGLPATDRTIEEIVVAIRSLPDLSSAQKTEYVRMLKNTDLVKFTDHHPAETDSRELLDAAENFVRQTEPAPPVPEPGGHA